MQLGDLTIAAHGDITPPAKLLKALAVLSQHLHPTIATIGWRSKNNCIACSLIVREYLYRLGFKDAHVRSVMFYICAEKDGVMEHSLGIGSPLRDDDAEGWSGHLVAVAGGWLIDTTLYPAQRAQWADMTGMMAAPLDDSIEPMWDMPVVAAAVARTPSDSVVTMAWLARPNNTRWRKAPDARQSRRAQRKAVAVQLVKAFGTWKD